MCAGRGEGGIEQASVNLSDVVVTTAHFCICHSHKTSNADAHIVDNINPFIAMRSFENSP